MMRFETECSGPCLDFCVCDLSHFTEDWKEKHSSCKEPKKISETCKKGLEQVMFLDRGPVKSLQ